jgi:hypothetical protein
MQQPIRMGVLQRKLAALCTGVPVVPRILVISPDPHRTPFFDVDEDPAIRVTEATNRSMRLHPAILDPGREHVKAPAYAPLQRRSANGLAGLLAGLLDAQIAVLYPSHRSTKSSSASSWSSPGFVDSPPTKAK